MLIKVCGDASFFEGISLMCGNVEKKVEKLVTSKKFMSKISKILLSENCAFPAENQVLEQNHFL